MDFEHALPARPTVHPSSAVKNCVLGAYTEIGPGCALEETRLGDYSYCFAQNDIIYSDIGKFCSIATGVRLNPAPHPSSLAPGAAPLHLPLHEIRLRPRRRQRRRMAAGATGGHRKRRLARAQRGHHGGRDDRRWGGRRRWRGRDPRRGALRRCRGGPRAAPAAAVRRGDGRRARAHPLVGLAPRLLRERDADFRTIEGFCEKYDPLRAGSK